MKSCKLLRKTSSQVIQDLQDSYGTEVGIAYFDMDNNTTEDMIPTWMFQLAFQCSCVPLGSGWDTVPTDAPYKHWVSWYQRRHVFLLQALFSILPNFRRTYIILDGFARRASNEYDSNDIPSLLEQDFGNVSIAIFSRDHKRLDPIMELADVSIRLLKAEPSANTLRGYCRTRVEGKVKPELVTAGFQQPEVWLDDIEKAICNASDGL